MVGGKTKLGLDLIAFIETRMKTVNEVHGHDSKQAVAVGIEFGQIRKFITSELAKKPLEAKKDGK